MYAGTLVHHEQAVSQAREEDTVRQCVQLHWYTTSCNQGTSGQAREEDPVNVYGYTGTLYANSWAPHRGALAEHDAEGGRLRAVRRRVGPGRYCSPHHRMPINSRNESYRRVSMTWRESGLVDTPRHII